MANIYRRRLIYVGRVARLSIMLIVYAFNLATVDLRDVFDIKLAITRL